MAADVGGRVEEQASFAARASLFGRFQLSDCHGTAIVLSNRRARALLAMLCVEPDQPLAREQVTALLWPGRFDAQARASLRQCLLELGKALESLGQPLLLVTRDRIALNVAALQTDLSDLETALKFGEYQHAIRLLGAMTGKNLLDDVHLGNGFANWLTARHNQIALRLQASIDHAQAELGRRNDEVTSRRLLGAWAQFQPQAVPPAAPRPAEGRTRIAVLPFEPLGHTDVADYFTDGMVDELITTLGQLPQLLVAGRTSSFHYRGSPLVPAEIARELGVTHLIEGSVQRQGERVRIHVHLIAGDTGFEHWGERFDGTLDDVFGLQENVAQAITEAIGRALGIAIPAPLVRGMTRSKAAYDLYLQGRALCARLFGQGVLDNAIALLEQSVSLDPDFAEAWVALSEAHQLVATYTQCPDRPAATLRMAECARRAIALAPTLGYPHALLGVYEWVQRNVVGALDLAYRAYALEPDNPAVTMRLGSFLLYCGRTSAAAPFVEAAISQDPADPRKHSLVWAMNLAQGKLEAARNAAQRFVDLGFPSTHLAFTSAVMGEHDLAIEQYQQAKQLVNTIILPPVGTAPMTDEAMDAYWLVGAKGICGGQEADYQIYTQLLEMIYATLSDKGDLAITVPAIMMGNAELTFKSLGLYPSPANMVAFLPLWADIDPVRKIWQHSEFIPFAKRIGMAAAWDKYGWPDLLPVPRNRV